MSRARQTYGVQPPPTAVARVHVPPTNRPGCHYDPKPTGQTRRAFLLGAEHELVDAGQAIFVLKASVGLSVSWAHLRFGSFADRIAYRACP
jgi:hypothetical protein